MKNIVKIIFVSSDPLKLTKIMILVELGAILVGLTLAALGVIPVYYPQ